MAKNEAKSEDPPKTKLYMTYKILSIVNILLIVLQCVVKMKLK